MSDSIRPGRAWRALLLTTCALGCLARSSGADVGDVRLVPPAHDPAKGTTFTVALTAEIGSGALGAYEVQVRFDPDVLQYLSTSPAATTGFTNPVRVSTTGVASGVLRLAAYQRTSRTEPVGLLTLANLQFRAIGLPGTSSSLDISVLQLLDPEVSDITAQSFDATVVVNLFSAGDVNGDGVPNQVSDAVFLTRALLLQQGLTLAQLSASDVNGDGTPQSVADLVYLVNVLLGVQPPIGKQPAGTGSALLAQLGSPQADDEWLLVPVLLSAAEELGGALMRVRLGAGGLEVGEPRLGDRAGGMDVAIGRADGDLLVLVHSARAKRIGRGEAPLLWLPVRAGRADARAGNMAAAGDPGALQLSLVSVDAADVAGASRAVGVAADHSAVSAAPLRLAFHGNVPNPFNPKTELRFDLPAAARARLAIYDVAGRRVTNLLDRDLAAGGYRLTWDGTDTRGVAVASGVYHARLEVAGQAPMSRKMVLVR
jgi:hypothetical protein